MTALHASVEGGRTGAMPNRRTPDSGPTPGAAPRGVAAVRLELRKLRHKHLPLIAIAIMAAQVFWLGATSSRGVQSNPDFRLVFFSLPTMNAIFMPVLSGVIASTVCDIENRGNMFKELLTMQPARNLFAAKWGVSALVIGIVVTVQTVVFTLMVGVLGCTGAPGPLMLMEYWASTMAVCLFIATLIQVLSLFFANQFLPMVVSVGLSFLGLFVMYLPKVFAYFVPSAYFGILSTVGIGYDAAAGVATYTTVPWSIPAFALIVALTVAMYALASRAFARKEL